MPITPLYSGIHHNRSLEFRKKTVLKNITACGGQLQPVGIGWASNVDEGSGRNGGQPHGHNLMGSQVGWEIEVNRIVLSDGTLKGLARTLFALGGRF